MSTTKNYKFKIGDIVAFNFTVVKTPMKIIGFRKKKYAKLEHRDLGYDCGEIDMEYIEKYNSKAKENSCGPGVRKN